VLRGTHDEDGDKIPEQDCDYDAEQDCRDLFVIPGEEIFPAGNDVRVRLATTLIGDRKKTQQGWEEQSARKEAFQDCGKMLARGGIGHGSEGPPKIEIDHDTRRDRESSTGEIGHDQILFIRQL